MTILLPIILISIVTLLFALHQNNKTLKKVALIGIIAPIILWGLLYAYITLFVTYP